MEQTFDIQYILYNNLTTIRYCVKSIFRSLYVYICSTNNRFKLHGGRISVINMYQISVCPKSSETVTVYNLLLSVVEFSDKLQNQ